MPTDHIIRRHRVIDMSRIQKRLDRQTESRVADAPLTVGMHGGAVVNIRRHLEAAGFDAGPKKNDNYGAHLAEVVADFQEAAGLEVTGEVGSSTWQKLSKSLFDAKDGTSPAQRLGEQSGAVKKLEAKLKELGLKTGKVDGFFSEKTQDAVKRFQARHDLKRTGMVGDFTMKKIDAALIPHFKKIPVPNGLAELNRTFGAHGPAHQVTVKLPMGHHGQMIPVTLHEKIVPTMKAMLAEAKQKGLLKYIDTFNGMYNNRKMRNPVSGPSDKWSVHSWGVAFDINANTGGWPGHVNERLAHLFESYGFKWGKAFGDPMHFQYVTGY